MAASATSEDHSSAAPGNQLDPSPPPTTVIDENGDLVLVIGHPQADFTVCSRAMSQASPFFKTLLFGPFAESQKPENGAWRIDLPEDDPESFEVLLNIIHGRHTSVPSELESSKIFKITIITDKYDLTGQLAPYAVDWLETSSDAAIKEGGLVNLRHIWISHELGNAYQFKEAVFRAIWNSCLEDGEVVVRLGFKSYPYVRLSDCWFLTRLNLVETITQERHEAVQQVVNHYQSLYEALSCPKHAPSHLLCKYPDLHPELCNAEHLFELIKYLTRRNLFPPDDYRTWKNRPKRLHQDFAQIQDYMDISHSGCIRINPKQLERNCMKDRTRKVMAEKKASLNAQAKKVNKMNHPRAFEEILLTDPDPSYLYPETNHTDVDKEPYSTSAETYLPISGDA